MAIRVRNVADVPLQQLPGRWMAELFSAAECGSERVTLRVVELPRLVRPARRHPHEHADVEECILVLAGHGRVWINGETAALRPGDALLVPPATPHVVLNHGQEVLRMACFFPTPDLQATFVDHAEIELPEELLYGRS